MKDGGGGAGGGNGPSAQKVCVSKEGASQLGGGGGVEEGMGTADLHPAQGALLVLGFEAAQCL